MLRACAYQCCCPLHDSWHELARGVAHICRALRMGAMAPSAMAYYMQHARRCAPSAQKHLSGAPAQGRSVLFDSRATQHGSLVLLALAAAHPATRGRPWMPGGGNCLLLFPHRMARGRVKRCMPCGRATPRVATIVPCGGHFVLLFRCWRRCVLVCGPASC